VAAEERLKEEERQREILKIEMDKRKNRAVKKVGKMAMDRKENF
jgi:hypothetical protein